MTHNENVKVKGITFTGSFWGHFIELNSSKNVEITNNTFQHGKTNNKNGTAESINIDLACKECVNVFWSKFDYTTPNDILINNNHFENLASGVGTHYIPTTDQNGNKIPENKIDTYNNIRIINNKFKEINTRAISLKNWKNYQIKNNVISFKHIYLKIMQDNSDVVIPVKFYEDDKTFKEETIELGLSVDDLIIKKYNDLFNDKNYFIKPSNATGILNDYIKNEKFWEIYYNKPESFNPPKGLWVYFND